MAAFFCGSVIIGGKVENYFLETKNMHYIKKAALIRRFNFRVIPLF